MSAFFDFFKNTFFIGKQQVTHIQRVILLGLCTGGRRPAAALAVFTRLESELECNLLAMASASK